MKKKRWILTICVVVLLAWIIRVVYLNAITPKPVEAIFEMDEIIEYGDDFYDFSDENRNGYKIQIKNAEVKKYSEYASQHNLVLPSPPEKGSKDAEYFFRPENVIDVEVVIYNDNNNEGAIDLFNTLLTSTNVRMRVDLLLWGMQYPQLADSYSFTLQENSEMSFNMPFVVETEIEQTLVVDRNFLENKQFYMILSQYPIKKMVKIDVN